MTGKIFFSYSRTDSSFVLKLAEDLRDAGFELWLDRLDIKAGDRWDASIERALETANLMIVVLSTSSVNSNNVMDEVSFALESNKNVIPVLLSECKVPFRLKRLQHIDFTGDYRAALNQLLEVLGSSLEVKKEGSSASEEFELQTSLKPSKSKSFLRFFTTLPGIITAVAGLITAIGGLVLVLNKSGCAPSKESAKIDTTATHTVAIDTLVASTANISFSPQQIKHTTRNLTYKIIEANTETLPDRQIVLTLKIKCINDSKYDYNFYSRYISVKIGEDSYPPSPYSPSEAYQAIDPRGFKDLEYNYKLPAGTKNFTLVFYDEENQVGVSSFTIK